MLRRLYFLTLLCTILFTGPALVAQSFDLVKVADGVYSAIGRNGIYCNSAVIINSDYVIVVDTQMRRAWAQDLIAQLHQITNKPVRYVIYSHWHPDHVNGSQAYATAFPTAQFIGQDYERQDMADLVYQRNADVLNAKNAEELKNVPTKFGAPAQIAEMERELAEGTDRNGNQLDAKVRSGLPQEIAIEQGYLSELPRIHPILPMVTFDNEFVLHDPERDIYLYHVGKAHTRGDTFIYLPKEKVMITGDLATNGVPGGHDGYPVEWIKTLEVMDEYDWTAAIPAHGDVQHGKDQLEKSIFYLKDMVAQVKGAVAKGLNLEQTEKAVDLSAHAADFPRGDFKSGNMLVVARAWAELTNQPRSINGEPFLKD